MAPHTLFRVSAGIQLICCRYPILNNLRSAIIQMSHPYLSSWRYYAVKADTRCSSSNHPVQLVALTFSPQLFAFHNQMKQYFSQSSSVFPVRASHPQFCSNSAPLHRKSPNCSSFDFITIDTHFLPNWLFWCWLRWGMFHPYPNTRCTSRSENSSSLIYRLSVWVCLLCDDLECVVREGEGKRESIPGVVCLKKERISRSHGEDIGSHI